jgi:precorrin-6Y C5,15-methyltransferase (decarboxylating)
MARANLPAEGEEVEPPSPWLTVIGIGDDGLASLGEAARRRIGEAELLVGGERHLALIPDSAAARRLWERPLEATLERIAESRGRRVLVLASGDPMHFGVGALLAQHFLPAELRILPGCSAFSLGAARLGWPLARTLTLSLHNRPAGVLRRHLSPDARLLLLSHDGETPHLVASILVEQGFAPSRITVFEHLGGAKERRIEGTAGRWPAVTIAGLNTIAVECLPGAAPTILPATPGLADEAFEADGMLTKREVRAATLARLMPLAGQCVWDVGAGSGAIAIEWLRAIPHGRALAIERDPVRSARMRRNAEALGTPELEVIEGEAPACLEGLAPPDAVFLGGGITRPGLIERAWAALPAGGRLVANVVTLEGERRLLDWQAAMGGELVRIAISRAEPVGPYQGWRPLMPVTQLAAVKP